MESQVQTPQNETMTLGDFLAEPALVKSVQKDTMTLDEFMGGPVSRTPIVAPVSQGYKRGFIKSAGMQLYGGWLRGAASIYDVIGYGVSISPADIITGGKGSKQIRKWAAEERATATKIREETYSQNKGTQLALDFVASLGDMGYTIPVDILTGGQTKLALTSKVLPKVESLLSRIPDFALGSGWRGMVSGIEAEGNIAEKTIGGIVGAGESVAIMTAYGKAGGGVKSIPVMGSLGWGSSVYEAAKEGRLPTADEQVTGTAMGLAYGMVFAILPHLKEATKIGSEKAVLGRYEKQIQERIDNGDFEGVKTTVDIMMADKKIRPEIKEAIGKILEQPQIKAETPVTAPIPPELEPLAIEARKYKTAVEFVSSDLSQTKGFEQLDNQIRTNLEKDSELIKLAKKYKKSIQPNITGSGDQKLLGKQTELFTQKYNQQLTDFYTQATTPKEGQIAEIPGGGETKVRGLALGVEEKAIENKLTKSFGDLPEYQTLSMRDQALKAMDLLAKDPERARRIAMGEELAPENILPESLFVAVENRAVKSGDVATLRDLGVSSRLVSEATTMGQRIRTLAERDPESPVSAINEVVKARRESAQKRFKNKEVDKLVKENIDQIKQEIKKLSPTKQTWAEFIRGLEC